MAIKITKELVTLAVEEAKEVGNKVIRDFNLVHGKDDFGTCGFATIAGLCGRKRKLREFLEDNGVNIDNWGGRYKYTLDIQTSEPIYTQSIDIRIDVVKAQIKVLNERLGLELFTHSWVD